MTHFFDKPIDESSSAVLLDAFTEACRQHEIVADSRDGSDLATILTHAYYKGMTSAEALAALVSNLVGK